MTQQIPTEPEMTPEEQELFKTQRYPANRRQRRAIAKRAGVRFNVVNPGMRKQPPVYLGIRQFKKAAGADKKLATEYKENAHLSLKELQTRRALEAAQLSEGKEISPKQMKGLKKK